MHFLGNDFMMLMHLSLLQNEANLLPVTARDLKWRHSGRVLSRNPLPGLTTTDQFGGY
jgi:hypothetical protein